MEETFSALTPGVHLIIMRSGREGRTFADEFLDPRCQQGMGQVPVCGLELRTGGRRAGHLAAFWIDLHQATDLTAKRLDHRRPVRLVFDQF